MAKIINPYADTNWATCQRIMSVSHEHGETQSHLDAILNGGVKHLPLSNYYPSKPWYPLEDYFQNVPSDVLSSPNAEHHSFHENGRLHLNGLGSFFESGSPTGESPVGNAGASWREIVPKILAELQYPDAGGVTINHPNWTNLQFPVILDMLDSDDRVLGIEFFNGDAERNGGHGWDLDTWDSVLRTGRRCWGFCVPDHDGKRTGSWWGRDILLTNNYTEYDCLRAYRTGSFYGQIMTTDLAFASIALSGKNLSIRTENAEEIRVVTNLGTDTYQNSNSVVYAIPENAVYVRIEATQGEDAIYSNPIILKPRRKKSPVKSIILYD